MSARPVAHPPSRTSAPSARRLALALLVEIDAGARANVAVPAALDRSGLERRDRALVTELVYGTCRMRRACDFLVERHLRTRTDPEVRAALRLGAYQLTFMRVPAHAAVDATVGEVRSPGRTVVNAVLRRVADDLAAGRLHWPDPPTALSYPDWIVERLAVDLGPEPARAALETMNLAAEVHERPDGYVQDPASQMVAAHVDARPGQRVLDLCAAPGGKATALAGLGASVTAVDNRASRCALVTANARGLGSTSLRVVVADGRRPPFPEGCFERVLVDAPCSGLGVLRRRPDARWRVAPDDVGRLAGLQRDLLAAAAPLVAPGGRLVYSVCTLTRAETLEIDRWAASALAGWRAVPVPASPWQRLGRGGLLLPQSAGTDGMYVLGLLAPPARLAGDPPTRGR